MIHHLKIWPGSFDAVMAGEQLHEIRSTKDRNFTKGDLVILREWIPDNVEEANDGAGIEVVSGHYTERKAMRKISYVSVPGSWGLPPDLCVFSITK